MVKKRVRQTDGKKASERQKRAGDRLASEPPPDKLTPPQAEVRRTAVTEEAEFRRQDERLRREDLRFNMLRSVLTEPLLSKVQEEPGPFDVIISLNELYTGGIDAALEIVRGRATEWKVP